MALALGYPHPDIMLRYMTSRQIAEWYAYATIEPVGNPVDVKTPEGERKAKRARIEAGLKSLMEKQKRG